MRRKRKSLTPTRRPTKPIVHLIRASLDFATWKERKPMATALRPIDTAVNADAASAALEMFDRGPWGRKFSTNIQRPTTTD